MAASGLGISLTDSEKSTLVQLYNKFKNMNLDENELRTQITKVYDKLESLDRKSTRLNSSHRL